MKIAKVAKRKRHTAYIPYTEYNNFPEKSYASQKAMEKQSTGGGGGELILKKKKKKKKPSKVKVK